MDVISYILSKKYVDDSLAGAGALAGKSAYEIAQENGFSGTPAEWLASLKGDTPEIGPAGTWVISGIDTGVIASPSLAGYATEEFVNQQIAAIDFPEPDLTPYATRKELSEAILGIVIPDVSEFATKEELEDAIGAIQFPETNLTDYATKQDVSDAIAAIPEVDLTGLATEDFVKEEIGKIDIPEVDLTPYALKSEIPDTSGLATEEYVTQKIAEAELGEGEVDLSAYYTKSEVDNKLANIEHPTVDLSGYATEQFVQDAVAAIPQPDLSGYATDEELLEAIGGIQIPSTEGLATEEFVEERIAEIAIPDTTGLATESYVDEAIANIEHPSVDLSGLATEEYVQQKIAEAELADGNVDLSAYYTKSEIDSKFDNLDIPEAPDLSNYVTKDEIPSVDGLASETYVNEAIAAIEIPEVDLSNYATKDELPSVTGLASEAYVDTAVANLVNAAPETLDTLGEVATALAENQDVVDALNTAIGNKADKSEIPSIKGLASEEYVNNAIANIEIPEAKADVNVYEISSDSAVLDELIALLPEGVEINQGDVMLVTNTLGVKSAYQFDETWIACDGNVDASKVIMPFDITLAGSYTQVGNLSKSSTGTATFATKGKSVAAALQEILSKREQPKIKSNPSVSLTASNGAKEVGTSLTPTWSASLNAGSYTYGPATGIVAKTWAISDTDGNTAATASGSFPAITVGDDTNYRITAKAIYDAGAVAVDNLGDPSNPTIQIAAGSKSANGSYITGYRAWFMYVGESLDTIDSAFIRGTTNKGSSPST